MDHSYQKATSQFFKVFNVDLRSAARGILTGDADRDARNVAMLLATVNAVSSLLSPREVTKRLVDMLVELTGADRGMLLVKDAEAGLKMEVGRDRSGKDLPAGEPISSSVTRQVLDSAASVCIVDTLDPGGRELGTSVVEMSLRAIMCAPLRMRGDVFGVVYVDSTLANQEFNEADLVFFEALCLQVAVILENSRLSRAMIDAERQATIGQMTSMILHDLASPLNVVDYYARVLEKEVLPREQVVEMAQRIRDASTKLLDMLQSARDYARGNTSYEMSATSLAMLVQAHLGQLQRELGERGVELELKLTYLGLVEIESARVDRMLTNLVNNALEAMPSGGRLSISLEEAGPGDIRLAVSDTGIGIPADRLESIFRPFVTHGKRHGTGLGLAIVEQIINNHGGRVTVQSVPGVGTTFTVLMPKVQPPAQ